MNNFKHLVIANWKMNLSLTASLKLAKQIKTKFKNFSQSEVVLCPDFLALAQVRSQLATSSLKLGAQDMFWQDYGSYTGEVAPSNLKQIGCQYVILGHSERRQYLQEDYTMINFKVKKALEIGLTPVMCFGETEVEKKSGKRNQIFKQQITKGLANIKLKPSQKLILAYEPIWAIGSGEVIKPEELKACYKTINSILKANFKSSKNIFTIYGGSVNLGNVSALAQVEEIDGLLVGGASLDANEFFQIAKTMIK